MCSFVHNSSSSFKKPLTQEAEASDRSFTGGLCPATLRTNPGAFTLIEVIVAACIVTVGFLGLLGMVTQSGKLVYAAEEVSLACSGLEQEMDLLRTLSWSALTSGTGITGTVWASQPASLSGMTVTNQTITISAYNVANGQTITGTWNPPASPTASLNAASPALSTATAVKVVASITWRQRRTSQLQTRSLVTVIAKGGISASTLP
jgi:Tfp pilus assembly protein PilV